MEVSIHERLVENWQADLAAGEKQLEQCINTGICVCICVYIYIYTNTF